MQTLMFQEARQSAHVVGTLLSQDHEKYAAWARHVVGAGPTQHLTVARGSSDHAAGYMGYLLTMLTGKLVSSLPMSHVSLYHTQLDVKNALAIALSQSGRSPDLLSTMKSLSEQGAITTALVNDLSSPLATLTPWAFGLHAGVEKSVAATKSYIASLASGARLVAHL
jgi:glutamine---fructose-6-phosphate transaminase (isomerizing)